MSSYILNETAKREPVQAYPTINGRLIMTCYDLCAAHFDEQGKAPQQPSAIAPLPSPSPAASKPTSATPENKPSWQEQWAAMSASKAAPNPVATPAATPSAKPSATSPAPAAGEQKSIGAEGVAAIAQHMLENRTDWNTTGRIASSQAEKYLEESAPELSTDDRNAVVAKIKEAEDRQRAVNDVQLWLNWKGTMDATKAEARTMLLKADPNLPKEKIESLTMSAALHALHQSDSPRRNSKGELVNRNGRVLPSPAALTAMATSPAGVEAVMGLPGLPGMELSAAGPIAGPAAAKRGFFSRLFGF